VLGLLGGSAELARCPQFISFSGTTLPVSAVAQSLPTTAGYQEAAFHVSNNVPGAAHETLLKASMPMNRGVHPVTKTAAKHRRTNAAPTLSRSKQLRRAATQQMRPVVVLSSWEEQERPTRVFAVTEERVIFTSYAAVPTVGGWLIIQL
jgi:hypothetical protein